MDLISNKPSFRRSVLLIWSIALLLLHVIYTILSIYHSYIGGDIMYKSADTAMKIIIPIIALLLVYLRFGVLVSAYHSYTSGIISFTLTAAASLVLTRICELIICGTVYSDFSENIAYYLTNALTSFMIDLAVVLILLLLSRSKKEKERKAFFLIFMAALIPFVITITEEIIFLIDFLSDIKKVYGSMALTGNETASILLTFAKPVFNGIFGFFFMWGTHKFLVAKTR